MYPAIGQSFSDSLHKFDCKVGIINILGYQLLFFGLGSLISWNFPTH
jgi:hypothetical protein